MDNDRRLLLRPFGSADLIDLRAAIDESLEEVQRWLPWGAEEPSTLEHLGRRIDKYAAECADGTAWRLALVDESTARFLGSGALLPYPGPARWKPATGFARAKRVEVLPRAPQQRSFGMHSASEASSGWSCGPSPGTMPARRSPGGWDSITASALRRPARERHPRLSTFS